MSEHEEKENRDGRLSMWRAYAPKNGVALVLNNEPFLRPSAGFNAYTSPVEYSDVGDFEQYFIELYNSFSENRKLFESLGPDLIKRHFINAFRFAICSTKHPGFREEQEWRVIYNVEKSIAIKQSVCSINSIPQVIQKIPLKDNVEADIYGITLNDLVLKIIIGPSQFPNEIRKALGEALTCKGVTNPFGRISISDIPIRH